MSGGTRGTGGGIYTARLKKFSEMALQRDRSQTVFRASRQDTKKEGGGGGIFEEIETKKAGTKRRLSMTKNTAERKREKKRATPPSLPEGTREKGVKNCLQKDYQRNP